MTIIELRNPRPADPRRGDLNLSDLAPVNLVPAGPTPTDAAPQGCTSREAASTGSSATDPAPVGGADVRPRLWCPPLRLAAGVWGLQRADGQWCELAGVPAPLAQALDWMDGTCSCQELGSRLPVQLRTGLLTLIDVLTVRHLLVPEAPTPPVVEQTCVEVFGAGELAAALHGRFRSNVPGLAIVAPETLEADRGLLHQLCSDRRPYLLVRTHRNNAQLGPYVVPGRTPGLCCLDQQQVDADPGSWRLLVQLAQTPATTNSSTLQWVSGQVAAEINWINSGRSRLVAAMLSLDGCGEFLYSWTYHPACCQASSTQASSSQEASAHVLATQSRSSKLRAA